MTRSVCTECGEAGPPGEQFCVSCGHYLWSAGPVAAVKAAEVKPADVKPAEVKPAEKLAEVKPAEVKPVGVRPADAYRAAAPAGPETEVIRGRVPADRDGATGPPTTVVPRTAGARPPDVVVADGEAVLEGARTGGVELQLTNRSSIVEGYRVEPVDPPPWLTITVPPTRLMPGDRAVVRIGLEARSDRPVPAQRLRLRLRLRPESDQHVHTDVEIALVVPRVGGPATIRTEPAVVRLRDAMQGRFTVHVDNRGSNHPRRYVLSGSDDEGVVRFAFTPRTVEVPPGGGAAVQVQVTAPPPAAGERAERALTVRAAAAPDDGAGPVAVVRLLQETSTAPVEVPVRIRLEPSVLRTVDSPVAELQVVVDNRAGSRERWVRLAGRDPEQRIGFAFRAAELWVPAGVERATPAQVHAPLPRSGEQATRAFTVAATDGRHEVEAPGSWEQRASPAPIATARLALEPQTVVMRNAGTGRLRVHLDNRGSAFPLSVRLHGTDPEHAVRFGFRPGTLDVAPGEVGTAEVRVSAPRPDGAETLTRPFTIVADDGRSTVEAAGSIVASAGDRRPLWRVVLTVLGALLIAVGCFRDWLVGDPDALLPGLSTIPASIATAADGPPVNDARDVAGLLRILQPVERTITLLLAAVMVFGLTGVKGRLTRTTGLLVAVTMVALVLFWRSTGLAPADGALMVVLGGTVGFVGGLFVRR